MSDAGFSILRSHRHICWRMDTLKKPKRFWKPTRFLDIRLTCMDGLPWRCWNSKIDCLLVLCPTVCNNFIDTLQYLNISCNLYMLSLTSQTSRSSAVWEQALEQQALFRYSHHLWSFFWVKEPVSCQSRHSNCTRSSRGRFFFDSCHVHRPLLKFWMRLKTCFWGKDCQWSWPRLLRLSDIFFCWKDPSICETKCRSHFLAKVESWQQISLSKHAFQRRKELWWKLP